MMARHRDAGNEHAGHGQQDGDGEEPEREPARRA
jgi:hypothetical protein